MKFVLDIRHILLFLFILLFYSNQVLSTSLPKISEPSEAIYNDLKIKYNCIPNGTLDLDFVMLEGGVKGQLKKYKENEWDSYYAIVPSIENKKINFNMSIKNYNPITVGSSGFVIDLVEASIKLAGPYGHLVQSVNSCIPIIKDMFTYSKCIFTNENVNCSYESINGKVFFKCDATFDAECKIGKPIKQTSYDLIELKIKTKTEKYSCVVKFSSNEKELYLLSNKIKKLKNTEPLENCIQEDSLPTINIISNETTKNDNEITKIITSEETKITKNISTKSITVKTTTKIIQTNKKLSFIGDCINILFILLIIIFICSSIALGILIYLFRKKSQKSIKEIAEKGEKTVVVEDGQWEGNKKEENKSNKFMALKTVGMEADEGNMEDLGETGLTNIADDSDLSDGDEKVKKSKRDKEEDNNNKDSEVSKSRDGVEVPPEGVEVPETIQDTIVPNKVFGEDQPLYDTPL